MKDELYSKKQKHYFESAYQTGSDTWTHLPLHLTALSLPRHSSQKSSYQCKYSLISSRQIYRHFRHAIVIGLLFHKIKTIATIRKNRRTVVTDSISMRA